jgi:cytochrome P450
MIHPSEPGGASVTDTCIGPLNGAGRAPVTSWATDFDIFDAGYIADPYPVWDDLRVHGPVARTGRWGAAWLPTRYEDVSAIAHDVEHFSSRHVGVVPPP